VLFNLDLSGLDLFNRSQTRSPFLTMAAFLREATTQIYAFRDPVYV
jgi:hypothetical protein